MLALRWEKLWRPRDRRGSSRVISPSSVGLNFVLCAFYEGTRQLTLAPTSDTVLDLSGALGGRVCTFCLRLTCIFSGSSCVRPDFSDTYIRPTETLNCLSIADLKATPEGGWRGIFLVLPMTLNRSGLLSVSEKHRVT